MRVASRVIGIVLGLAGAAFFGLSAFLVRFGRKSVRAEPGPDGTAWIAGVFSAALGVGFMLAGRHYVKLDVNAIDETPDQPASRFAPYFIAHRRALKIVADVGLAISMIRLGAACFRVDWPGPWAVWPLLLASIGLVVPAIDWLLSNEVPPKIWREIIWTGEAFPFGCGPF